MGNPTMYKNKTMTWRQGRKLYYTNLNNNDSYYYYDSNGIRYKKVVNNNVIEYYLNGTQIMAENRINNGEMIYYLYDETGIMGMIYGGNYYLYDKNIFGDIVGIIDSNGNNVGSYTYDAWGNILSSSGSLANINPFRYRGYYFDVETEFYYLQTRYYDPDLMRFINADNYELIPELASSLYQLNLYAYCGNNPVMFTDESGESAVLAIVLSVIALIGLGLTIGGIASDNSVLKAIGLTMIAVSACISGAMVIGVGMAGATYLGILGFGTVITGIGSSVFAGAEYQQLFTENNWMLDCGLDKGLYNGLMITIAGLATIGTIMCNSLIIIGQMSTEKSMLDSMNNTPNKWKIKDVITEPGRSRHFKGGISYRYKLINKWTGAKGGYHVIIKNGIRKHYHFHPW